MISYELANELKALGFPQRGWGFRACEHNKEALKHVQRCDCQLVDLVSVPSLGELIHQIGKDFKELEQNWFTWDDIDYEWRAMSHDGKYAFGHSDEEAVANLYKEIKK